jgi:tetratricopeptide (TPR) repeat protein
MQAFIAAEQQDFSTALVLLKPIGTISPASAGPAAEAGYILNQLGRAEEGLTSYKRSLALSRQYVSQNPYQAPALRGIGFALIDLKRLDEAEKVFLLSLYVDPGNKGALNELAYIRGQSGTE